MSEQPGRYQRSFSGMIGALLISLLVISGFIAFRAITRDNLEIEPERLDWLEAVGFAQDADLEVVYPGSVPDDWRATSVESQPGRVWGIGFLVPEGFAGLVQSTTPVARQIETYIDEEAVEGDPVEIDGRTWETWSDDGGDLGYLGEVDGQRVLVYGSAPASALESLAGSLTTAPLAD